jgi:hypothetical protein
MVTHSLSGVKDASSLLALALALECLQRRMLEVYEVRYSLHYVRTHLKTLLNYFRTHLETSRHYLRTQHVYA